jgi:hypothetical protein
MQPNIIRFKKPYTLFYNPAQQDQLITKSDTHQTHYISEPHVRLMCVICV